MLEEVFGPQSSSSSPPLSTLVIAGPLGAAGAGAGAGVLGRELDLSLAPAADDGPLHHQHHSSWGSYLWWQVLVQALVWYWFLILSA